VFDPVLKNLADRYSPEWVGFLQRLLGLPTGGEIQIVQPNLPTGTIEADRVYRVSAPAPMLIHTEWESSSNLDRPDRFLVYNTLLTRQTGLPVQTVVVLLRREANSINLTGVLTRSLPTGEEYLVWRYTVVRLWELSPAMFLDSPGLTPFAPLCAVTETELPALTREIEARWAGLPERQVKDLKAATEILMGVRFDRDLIRRQFGGVEAMEESVIYQDILGKGRAEGSVRGRLENARQDLIDVGTKRLGAPSKSERKVIEECTDPDRLKRLLLAAVDAPNWATVLATE
jgi:hypothetical protein